MPLELQYCAQSDTKATVDARVSCTALWTVQCVCTWGVVRSLSAMTSGSPGAQEKRSPDSQQWPTTTYLPVSAEGVFLSTTIGCCAPYLTRQSRAERNVLGTLIVSGANMVKCQKGDTQSSYLGVRFNSMHTSNEQKHYIMMYKLGWTVLSYKKGCHDMRWITMLIKARCYRTQN